MKSKFVLSLILTACISLSAATMVTNANFTAVATANNNVFTMGTVQLQNTAGQTGQSILMDKLFDVSGIGFDQVGTTTAKITIQGSFPVKLSANILGSSLPWDEVYTTANGFQGSLTNYFKDINLDARWWRQYKLAITAVATKGDSVVKSVSRENTDGYDSFFDTLSGTSHTGSANTTGLSGVLAGLGTLQPGTVVTITTQMQLISALYDSHDNQIDTLSNDQQNIFQGLSLGANVNIIATQE